MIPVMEEPRADAVGFDVQMDTVTVREKIERLKTTRQALGWSEEVCAYHLGVTYSTLNRWERGESLPKSRAVLKAIDQFIARHSKEQVGRG